MRCGAVGCVLAIDYGEPTKDRVTREQFEDPALQLVMVFQRKALFGGEFAYHVGHPHSLLASIAIGMVYRENYRDVNPISFMPRKKFRDSRFFHDRFDGRLWHCPVKGGELVFI
jgi:hypothetical protein